MAEPRYTGRPPAFIGNNAPRQATPEFQNIITPTESAPPRRGVVDYDNIFDSFNTRTSASPPIGLGNSVPQAEKDHRVRLKAKPGQEAAVYGSGPLSVLYNTNGLVFPYTPQIEYAHAAKYSPIPTVHTNQEYNYYSSTTNPTITFSGRFTAQNKAQAAYCFAAIHFTRTVTKMRFGVSDGKRGLPPPILLLEGYGNFMFNDLPVILSTSSVSLPSGVDYVQVPMTGGEAWVPVDFTIAYSLTVQNTPSEWRDQFNWDKFRDGQMLGNGVKGWS